MKKVIIIGAGISGLSVGAFLSKEGYKVTILEKENTFGGMCSSFNHNDFIVDYGPHKIYSQLPGMMKFFDDLLGEDNLMIKKKNSIALKGKYFSFPINPMQMIKNINTRLIYTGVKVGLSYGAQQIPNFFNKKNIDTYEDYFIKGFGKEGYKLMFKDYANKVWASPETLSVDIAKKRVPVANALDLVKNIFKKENNPDVSAEYFYYPKYGIHQVCEKLAKIITDNNGKILLNSKISNIKKTDDTIISIKHNNKTQKVDYLISTIPINNFVNYLYDTKKDSNLKYSSLTLVYFILNKKKALNDNWIFFPEKEYIFNRVSEQKSFSPYTCPENKTLITAEVTGNSNFKLNKDYLIKKVKQDLIKAKLIKSKDIKEVIVKKFKNVYPIYDKTYKYNLKLLLGLISQYDNVFTLGRPGLFNYNNMDHCIDMSKKLTEHIVKEKDKQKWIEMNKYFDSYRIVD